MAEIVGDETGGSAENDLTEDFITKLQRWASDLRSEEAAASRAKERWLLHQAEEEASFVGHLIDLVERNAAVIVSTSNERSFLGKLVAVADQLIVLLKDPNQHIFVSTNAITGLRIYEDEFSGAPTGQRVPTLKMTMQDVIKGLSESRVRVKISTQANQQTVAGELNSAGQDFFTLKIDTSPPHTLYIPTAAVTEVTALEPL